MKWKLFALAPLLTLTLAAAPTRVTPINPAEAVFAPFWDYNMQEMRNWKVVRGATAHPFGSTGFSWSRKNSETGKSAFLMERANPVPCARYDTLISCIRLPVGSTLKITLDTDAGTKEHSWTGKSPYRDEYAMPLGGAKEIRKITLEIFDTGKNAVTQGAFLWMGLRNSNNLKLITEQRKQFAEQPLDIFMAPKDTVPSYQPRVGLLGRGLRLKRIQDEYQAMKKNAGRELLTENLPDGYAPEKEMSDILPFANPKIFGRIRDDNQNLRHLSGMLQKGVIAQNPELMRMAVRTALVMALTPNWDSTFLSDFADSGWDQRVFSHAVAAEEIALVLDYAGDLLSETGRQLLLKRLALEGLGQINYNIWKYSYLFGNNQLSVFTRGRIASYLVLEKAYAWNGQRVVPYTELAMQELYDSIDLLMHPDGSFLEGPGYFFYTVGSIQPALQMYANARGKKLRDVIPEKMKKLGAFGDTLVSTDRRGGLIPFSSSQGEGRHGAVTTYQFLAAIAPESQWARLYHDRLAKNRLISDLPFWAMRGDVPENDPPVKPFSELPVMGAMSSTRFLNGSPVKILMLGAKANAACHRHNDKGSFVLEFDGDTYAADPGGQNYADADAKNVVRADYHNMLVPLEPRENEKEAISPVDIRPSGKGDEKSFHAEISPAPASNGDIQEWKRTIDSPAPDRITITDSYRMAPQHKGARFLWITELPWKQLPDNTIRLDGQNSYALIRYPKDIRFSAETLTVRRKEKFTRLNFTRDGNSGEIKMEVELFRK